MSAGASNLDASLQLYPNPCINFLELRAEVPLRSIEVYDLHGKKVLHSSHAAPPDGSYDLRIDVSALPPGMYMLYAWDVQGREGVKKFVKGK